MKNYRFYAELDDHRASKSASKLWPAFTRKYLEDIVKRGWQMNVVAVPLENGQPMCQGCTLRFDIYSAVKGTSNSPVEGSSTDREYLRKRCVRIDEALARLLHPNLFAYLEK